MKNKKINKPIIIMLCYARSGGTVLNRCLGSLADIVMMSEVNPLAGGWGKEGKKYYTTIKEQAFNWYGMKIEGNGFRENVIELAIKCEQENLSLILRDYSFINFKSSSLSNLIYSTTFSKTGSIINASRP